MKLYLIRHGETPSNVDRLIDTVVPGSSLTALGQEQADALALSMTGSRIDAIYASTQYRTQQTAGPLAAAQGLVTKVRRGIREVEAGALESRLDEPSINIYKATFIAWADGDLDAANPGGETGWQAFARFNSVLLEASDADFRTVAVVSSGAMLRSWAGYHCDNIDAAFVGGHSLPNTGVIEVAGSPRFGWTAESWNGKPVAGSSRDTQSFGGPAGEPRNGLVRAKEA